jgi:hypothetical protein
MSVSLILQLVDVAIALAQSQTDGTAQQGANVTNTLLVIIRKSVQAYEDHTGKPLDPLLIRAEDPV